MAEGGMPFGAKLKKEGGAVVFNSGKKAPAGGARRSCDIRRTVENSGPARTIHTSRCG